MQTYLKTKPVWMQLLLFAGMAFGAFFALSLIGVLLLSNITGIGISELKDSSNWDFTNPDMIFFIRGLLLMQFLGLFVIPSLLFAYLSDPKPMKYIGLTAPTNHIYWILGIVALIAAIPLVEYIGVLNQKINLGHETNTWMKGMEEDAARQIQFMLKKHTISELLLNLLFIAVFAGVGEELFFRGIVQRLLIRSFKNPWMGIILTAAVFSAFHFQFYGFFPRLVLGIVLGAMYWYSGSIWTSIIAHFVYDALIIVLVYINPGMLENPDKPMIDPDKLIIAATVSLGITAFILWTMKRYSRTAYEEVYKDETSITYNS